MTITQLKYKLPCMMRIITLFCLLLVFSGCVFVTPAQAPLVRKEQVHPFGATTIAFSPNGEYLASGGQFGEVIVWKMPQLEKITEWVPHRGSQVRALQWVDNQRLLSAGEEGALVLHDVKQGEIARLQQQGEQTALGWNAAEQLLYSGNRQGELKARMLKPDWPLVAQKTWPAAITALDVSRNGQLAVATDDDQVYLLPSDLHSQQQLPSAGQTVWTLSFSPDASSLMGGTWFHVARWDVDSGKLQVLDTEHSGQVISLAWAPDGGHYATIGRNTDAQVRWTNSKTGTVDRRMSAHALCGYAVRVSPDGHYLATSSEDESIRLYDLAAPYKPVVIQP
ncbi:MAG: hypothetical protein KZQ58_08385 [gamma proteobacterium symbiont of Bathyaustriella thionipta]|nr:hypothetical protein [gamma proteobacterium symbiont of Bathyaustriella thionipta]